MPPGFSTALPALLFLSPQDYRLTVFSFMFNDFNLNLAQFNSIQVNVLLWINSVGVQVASIRCKL